MNIISHYKDQSTLGVEAYPFSQICSPSRIAQINIPSATYNFQNQHAVAEDINLFTHLSECCILRCQIPSAQFIEEVSTVCFDLNLKRIFFQRVLLGSNRSGSVTTFNAYCNSTRNDSRRQFFCLQGKSCVLGSCNVNCHDVGLLIWEQHC